MGRFVRPALALVLALFTRPGPVHRPASASVPLPGPGSPVASPYAAEDERWYEPRAEDFRPAYDRDIANGGKQTWEQYWGWVQSFYRGNLLAKGWNDRSRWLVEEIRSDDDRRRLRTRLNALGRDICSEWAKDYEVRKIGSADLMTWGKMMEKARTSDDGSGAAIHRSLDTTAAAGSRAARPTEPNSSNPEIRQP